MILVTSNEIPGKRITKTFGIVVGSTVRARHVGKDILAVLRNIVGGEVVEYRELLAESREAAISRMIKQAEEKGANGVIGVRFATSMIMGGVAEITQCCRRNPTVHVCSWTCRISH
ncbi:MAG: YbjQ family protein [Chloroflexi bacterium]|nr:YbjQ family protein [Chloroflexota bacterium]